MTPAYLGLLALVGLARLVELRISRRNQRNLEKLGVRKIAEPHFRWMVFTHAGILACAAAEVMVLHRPLIPYLAIAMEALFVLEVMASSRVGVVASGPYRWVRHPNYVAVVIELFALPMIHTAWITALAGTLANLEILRRRLRVEDSVLMADLAYRAAMGSKPRFLPKFF